VKTKLAGLLLAILAVVAAAPAAHADAPNITQQQADIICSWLRDPAWTMAKIETSTGAMLAKGNLKFAGKPDVQKAIGAAMSGSCPYVANQRPLSTSG
jgi:hypothetical protein